MLFEVIGAEWARSLAVDEPNRTPDAERILQEVLASASPEQLASTIRGHDDLSSHHPHLLAHARTEVLAGRRDVEQIGRALIAIGHLATEAQAAGHFLVGYAWLSRSAQSRRHFELAAIAYRDLRAPLLAGLAGLAAEVAPLGPDRIRGEVAVDGLLRAVTEIGKIDAECHRRLTGPVDGHIKFLRLAHELMTGGPVPSTLFAASEDDLDILRTAMVGALPQAERAAAIARWIQALRGLPADSVLELEQLVVMLGDVRDWEPRLALLRDMIAHGDRRDETLIELARTLTELRRWDEAKAELIARLGGGRPAAEHIELLRFMVMTGYTVGDPDTQQWAQTLQAVGGELPESVMPPTQPAEEAQTGKPRGQLRAHFENGSLTVDPSISPGEIKEHMMAAMILGLGAQEGSALRDDLAVKDPALYEKVLEYLPAYAMPVSEAELHLAEAEQLFGQRRYREAIGEYQAALAEDPDLESAQLGLGDAHYMLGEYRLAIAHFTESIAIRPTPQAFRFLGDAILRGQSDPYRAKQCYEQALDLDPGYGGARDALRQVTQLLAGGGADGR